MHRLSHYTDLLPAFIGACAGHLHDWERQPRRSQGCASIRVSGLSHNAVLGEVADRAARQSLDCLTLPKPLIAVLASGRSDIAFQGDGFGAKNLTAHRRSNLLASSRGISMTDAPASQSPPVCLQLRGALKVPRPRNSPSIKNWQLRKNATRRPID
jgi:hypothetical protein